MRDVKEVSNVDPSARALLLTILGEFVLPGGGTAWTSGLINGLATVGIEPAAARQAVARSAAAGFLDNEKVGRRARWHLSPHARRVLRDGAQRIYSFGRQHPPWDGRWLLLVLSVPETRRESRYRLRVRLTWAGFAAIGAGTWLSPWADREDEALAALDELDLRHLARSFVGAPGEARDPRSLAAEAWDLTSVEAAYERFIDVHARTAPGGDADAFAALTRLVHEWRAFPSLDPGLPRELLPARWEGQTAAELFHDRHAEWSAPARRWWQAQHDDVAD